MTKLPRVLLLTLLASLATCVPLSAQTWDTIVTVGPGYVDDHSRQVVRTAGNIVYIVATASCFSGTSCVSSVRVYKGSPATKPTSFAEMAAAHRPSSSTRIGGVDCRLGTDGIIHIIYEDDSPSTSAAKYTKFDTRTDTWVTPAEIIAGMNGQADLRYNSKIALVLDSSLVPHVLYPNNNTGGMTYSSRIGGAWASGIELFMGTGWEHPSMVMDRAGAIHVAWTDDSTSSFIIKYKQRSPAGTWLGTEIVASSDVSNNDADQGPSLAVDSANNPWICYSSALPNSNYRLQKRTGPNAFSAFDPGSDVAGHAAAVYIDSSDNVYAFEGHDLTTIQPAVKVRDHAAGNWGSYTQLAPNQPPTRDGGASIRFDPLFPASTADVDAIFFDEQASQPNSFGEAYYVHGTTPGAVGTPAVLLSPNSVPFGSQTVGTASAPTKITLTNTGTAQLNFSSIAITGTNASDFSLSATATTPCPFGASNLAADASCTFNVTFTPGAIGGRSANVAVTSNASTSPDKVSLTGTGLGANSDFFLSVSPNSWTMAAGGMKSFVLSITPVGGFAQAVSLSCSGSPAAATCTISPSTITLNGSSVSTANVSLTTTARSVLPPATWPRTFRPFPFWRALLAGIAALFVLAFLCRKRAPPLWRACLSAGLTVVVAMLCYACGGGTTNSGGGNSGTPAGSYTITLTGTSGSLVRTATINLTVN